MGYDPVKQKKYLEEYNEKNKEILKEKRKKRYEENKERYNKTRKENYEKNREREKEYRKQQYETKKEQYKEKQKERYEQNREQMQEYATKYREDLKQNAYDSISVCEILDQKKWDLWCNEIKRHAKNNKQPYFDDFTNDIIFDMMIRGCFYCGDVAITIDRIDSKLCHTLDNCIGCCYGCNMSKGAADPSTFIRKAFYRVRGEYYDVDTDIWFVNKQKPSMWNYKRNAEKKGVPFELTKEDWERLVKGSCEYCKRSPTTWFGVDRVVPSLGYVLGNVVSCCYDCNLDKLEDDVDTVCARNGRITARVDAGELIITECEKVILRRGRV